MTISIYNSYLLIIKRKNILFSIISIQIDNILILTIEDFIVYKEEALIFIAKSKKKLSTLNPLLFNSYTLTLKANRSIKL